MTRQAIIVAYAMTGRTARQIAEALQVPLKTVQESCRREGVMPGCGYRRTKIMTGTIQVRHYLARSGVGRAKEPATRPPYLPVTALRAAGLDKCHALAFTAADGVITLRKPEPKEPV